MSLQQNKRSGDNGQPWWLGAIYKVGVPAAIACYLIYFITQRVEIKLDDHNKLMVTQGYENTYYMKEQKNITEMQLDISKNMLKLMQQNCINTARTAERSTRECLD